MKHERLARYPSYLQDLVVDTGEARRGVTAHEAWQRMREGTIDAAQHRRMLVGFWPLIERFPQYLAQAILKTTHGRDVGQNAARSWLARNLRVEQQHAEWYLDWCDAAGFSRDDVWDGDRPVAMTAVADWCWQICSAGDLAEAMVATNFAVEGATGEWTPGVASSPAYRQLLAPQKLEAGLRWLQAHADYDDTHPWDALDIVAALVGANPTPARVRSLSRAAYKSYVLYGSALDTALDTGRAGRAAAPRVVAAR
ncbi:MAG: iron-containing redox enzyme family protein [bacterium]|nr:iron-containing redox enzyme family protein [bacterium]